MVRTSARWGLALGLVIVRVDARAQADGGAEAEAAQWVSRFGFVAPQADAGGVCAPSGQKLPAFHVTPVAAGTQLVRVSMPFAAGTFPVEAGLTVVADGERLTPDVRVLTRHPGRPAFVRRAVVTFPYAFSDTRRRAFRLELAPGAVEPRREPVRVETFEARVGDTDVRLESGRVEIRRGDASRWRADVVAPGRVGSGTPTIEVIERSASYLWLRMLVPDARWPRIIEVRADALGTVAARLHVQNLVTDEDRAPELGWRISGPGPASLHVEGDAQPEPGGGSEHDFSDGKAAEVRGQSVRIRFPDAHLVQRGGLRCGEAGDDARITYLRCRADEQVPHQYAAWRVATFVLSPPDQAAWTPLLEPPHGIEVAPEAFAAICECGRPSDLGPWPLLDAVRRAHVEAMASGSLLGDDYGNVTSLPTSGVFGMNRLNHCPPIFHTHYRTGDAGVRAVALQWCSNYHDLSIWWGTTDPKASADDRARNAARDRSRFGGTRYNNMARHHAEYRADRAFMWRSDSAVGFCTKGYDSFFYAYEETGDPRMATALRWQVAFARAHVQADQGECRNIGDVLDFVRLYRLTGAPACLDEGLRLFRELRTKLSAGDLFSQSGRPIVDDPPFIDNDKTGYDHPFAKPYIIGYALTGLPALAEHRPDEPKLRDVIRAVADFMAEAEDPVGGWRYPHPRSSRVLVGQGIEHAAQLARAAAFLEGRGERVENLLDAIERVLQARILAWQRTGKFFGGLGGWEQAAGRLTDGKTLQDLYPTPADRDPGRDYTEGAISVGNVAPEGVVYFLEVMDYYLRHRPAERLMNADAQLQAVLDRMAPGNNPALPEPRRGCLTYGLVDKLPTFRDALVDRLTFPLRYDPASGASFSVRREKARARLLECLLVPPPRASFDAEVLAREDRGGYEARKIAFNVSADCRVPSYLLVPDGPGPFPAMICLHDHGAHFLIGKEKVVRPFDVTEEIRADAEQWVARSYGGRYIGDELAARGYVVLAMDALFWGERGRKEGPDYNLQQALASNLLQMGMTWIGVITWDDMRSAEFVASLPMVDPSRIGAVGLSMGCHRTWMLAAATDRIAAGVAVCWMGTTEALTAPGNNQVKGHSAYSMLVPNLRNDLDYPDVAAIACPKPMTFYNGDQDGLFPVDGVRDAYAVMRAVWESQNAGDRLVTKVWPRGHVFDVEMQDEAFDWLDAYLRPGPGGGPAESEERK